jgi:glycosyltransferase involved in cell wall biosynthesis
VRAQYAIELKDIRTGMGLLRPMLTQVRLERLRHFDDYDVLVLDSLVTLALPIPRKPKHIVVLHHVDWDAVASPWKRALYRFVEPICLRNLRSAKYIVTVSKYWEQYAREHGFTNVRTIYNAFDEADFQVSDDEVADLRRRYGLTKPIVYIGNCQAAKGVVGSYEALRDLDVHLITSGERLSSIPAQHLDLSYREYLCLLRASSVVVTMSLLKEGWCRTAHEAMLLKRPVIGSGRGGMAELLNGGNQVVCPRFEDLRAHVQALLADEVHATQMGEEGFRFARTFSRRRFQEDWLELLSLVSRPALSGALAGALAG